MDLSGDIVIMSGEGTGEGPTERYLGARTAKALKARLTRERAHGDRVAHAWIAPDSSLDAQGYMVFFRLDDNLELNGSFARHILPSSITASPAAALRAIKSEARSETSRVNGAKRWRPEYKLHDVRWVNPKTGSVDTAEGWKSDYDLAVKEGTVEEGGWGKSWDDHLIECRWDGTAWVAPV